MLPWPGIDVTKTGHAAKPAVDPAVNPNIIFLTSVHVAAQKTQWLSKISCAARQGSGSNPVPFAEGKK
jgi:hypothetical protein